MNHCVPDFDIDDDYAISTAAAAAGTHVGALTSTRTKKIAIGDEEDIMELLWQNGQVVLQSQNQRSSQFKKPPNRGGGAEAVEIPQSNPTTREIRSFENVVNRPQPQLFIQEDEMASWLQYPIPIDDSSFAAYSNDLFYSAPSSPPRETRSIVTDIRPLTPRPQPVPPAAAPRPPPQAAAPKFQNFTHFSRLPKEAAAIAHGRSAPARELTVVESNDTPAAIAHGRSAPARELTVVESNDTPAAQTGSRVSQAADGESTAQLLSGWHVLCGTTSACSTQAVGTSTAAGDLATACEVTLASSPSGSGGSASASGEVPRMVHNPSTSTAEGRKRKGRAMDDTDGQSEDVEFEFADTKKQARGSTSAKRSRATEVHNLSERRRRDRINERMRALQELIPRCNKSDKASMLDEAIEYLKSLQLQVQMMSMGCGMLPLMYPGVQQYMPAMGMGMGMGMGMEMGMNRPIMPYPLLMPASGISNPAVAANMGPRFPVPAFHVQPVPDSSKIQASNQLDPVLNSLVTHNPNQQQMPNFADPYQQFIGLHRTQVPLPQNQVVVPPSKPSRSRGVGNPDKRSVRSWEA